MKFSLRSLLAFGFALFVLCASPVRASDQEKTASHDLGGGLKLELVLIPAGKFMMGSDAHAQSEKPAHEITITQPFYMGKFTVTPTIGVFVPQNSYAGTYTSTLTFALVSGP